MKQSLLQKDTPDIHLEPTFLMLGATAVHIAVGLQQHSITFIQKLWVD